MSDNWVYERTEDNKARFLLGEPGARTLVCIGINPSTAEPGRLDNTLTSVKRFSKDLQYDSWMMLNVYPQRATDPNDLQHDMDRQYHEENLKQIASFVASGSFDVWAAWGTNIRKRHYLLPCLNDIVAITTKRSIKWFTMGNTTKHGHPHHPLYLSRHSVLEPFNIRQYLIRQNAE